MWRATTSSVSSAAYSDSMSAIASRARVARVRMVVMRCMLFGVVLSRTSGGGCAAHGGGASARGVLDSVDLLVEPLAGLAAEDGGAERDCERRDQRDEAAGRQGAAVDGQPREVQRVEHVVLRPADRWQCGDDDGDEDPPQPHADALPRAVEAGHAAGDVAAEEVADCQHDEQADPAGEADGLGLRPADLAADLVERERGAGSAEDAGEDRRQAGGRQPSGERRQPREAAELVPLALALRRGLMGPLTGLGTVKLADAGGPVRRGGGASWRHAQRSPSPSASMRSLRTSSETVSSSV